jgi:hypothetical protein
MRRILGLVVAVALWLGTAQAASAQFSMSLGSPYWGGFSLNVPTAGAYYGGYVPGATYYSSGYLGYAPTVAPYAYPYGYTSYYGYAPVYRSFYGVAPYGVYRPGLFGLRRGFVGGFW